MSATTPEKCPKCGAEDHSVSGSGFTEYACGTRIKPTDPWVQSSYMCLRNQRDQLADRVKSLEEAGSLALGYASKGEWETADTVWVKAKGSK